MTPLQLIRSVAAGQDGVVTAAQCRDAGLDPDTVIRLCRSRRWLRLNRGAYLVGHEDEPKPTRVALIRAAAMSAGPMAVAVLDSAAEIHGMLARPGGNGDVHLSLPGRGARPRRVCEPGVVLHQFALRREDVAQVNGVRVTTPARTLADLCLRVSRFSAVSMVDSALNRRFLTPPDLDLVRQSMVGRRGAARAVPWLAEADERAESPLETRVRLRAVDGEVGPDELQYRLCEPSGRVVAVGDMAWIRSRLIGEADGVDAHDNPQAVFRDRLRQNDIVALGFVPVRFTWADTLEPGYVPRMIRAAMSRIQAA